MKILYTSLIYILIGWVAASQSLFAQQTPIFQQYSFAPELYNPARIGEDGGGSVMFVHRQEWLNIDDAPTSQLFSLNYRLSNDRPLALGIVAKNDKAGLIKRTDAALYLGYHFIETQQNRFSVGIYGGMNSVGVSLSDINVDLDPAAALSGDRMIKLDAGLGINFLHRNDNSTFNLGIASTQIPGTFEFSDSSTNLEFDFVNHILATLSWKYQFNSQFAIEPIVTFRTLPGSQKLKGGAIDAFLRAHIGSRLGVGLGFRPDAGSLFGMLSVNLTSDGRSRFIAVGDYHPDLDYSYEVAARAGFGEMITEYVKRPKPPKPDKPKPIIADKNDKPREKKDDRKRDKKNVKDKKGREKSSTESNLPTREAFWNSTDALKKKLRNSGLQNFADVRVVIGLEGTEVIVTYPDESSTYLVSEPSVEDRLITWTTDIVKNIMRQDMVPNLDEIKGIVLVTNFSDPSSIIEAEVADVSYGGEYGNSLTGTYLFDGQEQNITLNQGTDLLFLNEYSYLKLYSIREAISRNLNMSKSDIKMELNFEQKLSTNKEIQIRLFLPSTSSNRK